MRVILFAALPFMAVPAYAQRGLELRAEGDARTVMVRGYAGSGSAEPALQAVWRFPADSPATFSYQRLSAPAGDHALMLRPLLIAGIDQYLDQRIHFAHKGVTADASDERMLADLNAMAAAATSAASIRDEIGRAHV